MSSASTIHQALGQAAQDAYEMPILELAQAHTSHPSLGHLVLLVFEAVLEVVCVSLPGYIVARLGHFDADKQKFLANLNVILFTPCLIFSRLASQLTPNKLADLAIIPLIFVIQMTVSWIVSQLVARICGFNKRATNFVTAMGVFGNSNSLPISLVLSLSQTLKGLHWDKITGDNDDDVGARGILYLLIFQQLGQLVRWSWGYHVLLAPKDKYPEYLEETVEEGRYQDEPDSDSDQESFIPELDASHHVDRSPSTEDFDQFEPAGRTPVTSASRASLNESEDEDDTFARKRLKRRSLSDLRGRNTIEHILSFPHISGNEYAELPTSRSSISTWFASIRASAAEFGGRALGVLPNPVQNVLNELNRMASKAFGFLSNFMNPPLWAMLCAIVVASVPSLKQLFFEEGSFVKNSVTSAIQSNGGVAVPLILVVLGANLARNTQNSSNMDAEEQQVGQRLLIASLVSRMVLPTLIMAPILAVIAKYINVSILDDPIFIIVCFLLTGAPSALQLAQICQINGVYENVMSKILFQSYVIWILPSTLVLVMCALEVVEWAKPI